MFTKGDYKVGLFVLIGFGLIGVVIWLLGKERGAFSSALEYRIHFPDVVGLRAGAPVQMGGVRIGQVETVEYREESGDDVFVEISVVEGDANRVLTDTIAEIANKGLLGDKQVVLRRKTDLEMPAEERGEDRPKGARLPEHSLIPSKPFADFFGKLETIGDTATGAIKKVEELAGKLASDELQNNLKGTLAEIQAVLHEFTQGEGYPRRLLTDKTEADRISHLIDTLDKTATELGTTIREVRYTAERVRTGPGFAHEIIYGTGPQKQIEQFGNAADEVALALRGVRQADSFAHDLLFGGTRGDDAIQNVTSITADLRDIVRDIKAGKGTIGALLVDPSIYEDLKRVLGNVERNNVLRALVRYSIKRDDEQPKVEVGER